MGELEFFIIIILVLNETDFPVFLTWKLVLNRGVQVCSAKGGGGSTAGRQAFAIPPNSLNLSSEGVDSMHFFQKLFLQPKLAVYRGV